MSKTKSEDVLGEKWDKCLADTSIKILGGETFFMNLPSLFYLLN